MSQTAYIHKLASTYHLVPNKLVKVPVTVGSLLFLASRTRPDILYSVIALSQYSGAHTSKHVKALMQVLQYVLNTADYCIELTQCSSDRVWSYSDASWADDPLTSLSFGGFIVYLGGVPIVWSCKKQSSVACSTMEAEFVAMVNCVREIYCLCSVFDMCPIFNYVVTPIVYSDAMSSVQFTQNDVENSRTKHIRVKYHWLRKWHRKGFFNVLKIPGEINVADIFTKWLGGERIRFLCAKVFSNVPYF
uniref:Reverse transcriptase Ty1/copia-type domain-containing protein n=1 Tax=Strigamia maritima TaxID=126957 RepID=T1IRA5_STRMM